MNDPTPETSKVQVIDRAAELLSVLSQHPDGITLTELTRATGLHKATALRILRSLEQNLLAEKAATGKSWALGRAVFNMASRAERRNDLRAIARPIMLSISEELGETVQLAVMNGSEIVYVEKVEPADLPLKVNSQIGSRRPIHCTGLGKVISAYMDWDLIGPILDSNGMKSFTPQTITDREMFKVELKKIREVGHAIDNREYNNLVTCAAAPVMTEEGVVAGLSISILGATAESDRIAEIVAAVCRGAEAISRRLGYKPSER